MTINYKELNKELGVLENDFLHLLIVQNLATNDILFLVGTAESNNDLVAPDGFYIIHQISLKGLFEYIQSNKFLPAEALQPEITIDSFGNLFDMLKGINGQAN